MIHLVLMDFYPTYHTYFIPKMRKVFKNIIMILDEANIQ